MSHPFIADAAVSRRRPLLTVFGVLAVVGTYAYLVIAQPAEAAAGPSSTGAILALAGFLLGAALLLLGVLPSLPPSVLVLIPVALVLNIILGQFVGSTLMPIYLDSIGTVLIGFLAGPAAGAATGLLSTVVWSFFNPTTLPFAAGAALVGLLAGLSARYGAVRRIWPIPVVGLLTGLMAALVAAPVAVVVFGGTATGATGAVIALFRAAGDSLAESVTKGAIISDLVDKLVTFSLAAALAYALPRRMAHRFDFVRSHRVLRDEVGGRPGEAGDREGAR